MSINVYQIVTNRMCYPHLVEKNQQRLSISGITHQPETGMVVLI